MFEGKNILVTGGTGSFGKSFINEIIPKYNFNKIVVISRDEFKQDIMRKELTAKYGADVMKKIRFFIGDIRDLERLKRAFIGIDIVIHAAAMKQVPACEYNPNEAIKTNIIGAMNIIEAALDTNVEKVVALSTDKAVNPINLYGGTKLVSDKLFIAANSYRGEGGPTFGVVRYGNVSGSRGSVIPFFNELLKKGEKSLPITDFEMTRFWMTLDKAVDLVMLTLNKMKGGETFVFKNPSYKVTDIAKALDENAELRHVGIREGEKIHEVMITSDDSRMTYDYGDYYIIYPNFDWFSFEEHFHAGGVKIEEGFEYHSGNNSEWLSIEDIRKLIKEYDLV